MTTVIAELAQWGPQVQGPAVVSLAEAEAYCRQLARSHYENFPVASWLLPPALRQHFCNVYAYCRWADDLGDEIHDPARSLALLAWWREQLGRCYQGDAAHPVFVALRGTIDEFGIPRQPFDDLISAFEQDQSVHEYETFEQLQDYCRRSANPVGRIVLYLCRQSRDVTCAWSDSICTGLQLANFWQDVSRDFDMGRVYLPREDCVQYGYTREMLERRETNAAFLELMRFEVARARGLLTTGWPLVDAMPGRMQVDLDLFIRGGLQILNEIEAIGYRVWDRRPVVTKRQFARLFLTAASQSLWRRVRQGNVFHASKNIGGSAP
ncbi:MAG: squalene synthase HpnC [Planctomycetaceae bacterium]|nr:squalene synthase HpnC [Planctomycetaceae bacterium]